MVPLECGLGYLTNSIMTVMCRSLSFWIDHCNASPRNYKEYWTTRKKYVTSLTPYKLAQQKTKKQTKQKPRQHQYSRATVLNPRLFGCTCKHQSNHNPSTHRVDVPGRQPDKGFLSWNAQGDWTSVCKCTSNVFLYFCKTSTPCLLVKTMEPREWW